MPMAQIRVASGLDDVVITVERRLIRHYVHILGILVSDVMPGTFFVMPYMMFIYIAVNILS